MAEWTEQLTKMMRESVNASVEAAVKFQQQTWRLVDQLVQRGSVAKEEGKQLLDVWTQQTEAFQKRMEEKYRHWEEALKTGLQGQLPPSRKDVHELHRKIDQLMQNLQAATRTQPRKQKAAAKTKKPKTTAGRKKP